MTQWTSWHARVSKTGSSCPIYLQPSHSRKVLSSALHTQFQSSAPRFKGILRVGWLWHNYRDWDTEGMVHKENVTVTQRTLCIKTSLLWHQNRDYGTKGTTGLWHISPCDIQGMIYKGRTTRVWPVFSPWKWWRLLFCIHFRLIVFLQLTLTIADCSYRWIEAWLYFPWVPCKGFLGAVSEKKKKK